MEVTTKKPRFKKTETGYHSSAVKILASWVQGVIEQPFYVDQSIVFVPDVTVYKDGILQSIYEVVYSHPLDGNKYGLIQFWCYRNLTPLTVFEVSADFILAQTEKPEVIKAMDTYIVDPLEYEEIQDDLITPIK